MRAGLLERKIIIEQSSEVIDSVGDSTLSWTTFATVWANILTNSGKEFIQAREMHSSLSRIITIRYLASVTPRMRVNDSSTYYNILAAFDPNGRRIELKLYCDEQI
jgi:SPP1 family predicted phage head-tail adaptor